MNALWAIATVMFGFSLVQIAVNGCVTYRPRIAFGFALVALLMLWVRQVISPFLKL